MKRACSLVALLCAVGFIAAGCGCGHSNEPQDGVKPEASQQMAEVSELAKKVKGNFKLLTPEEKAKFIALFGSQAAAKKMIKMMANPPVRKQKS
jgi:hypothetical protein